jgi:hypothetical protein
MNMKKINVVLCGMRFGAAFVPIYRDHPDVESVGICDTNPEVLKRVAEAHGISRMYSSLEEVLKDDSVDAVHLVTPIPLHEEQAVKVLESGRIIVMNVSPGVFTEVGHYMLIVGYEDGKFRVNDPNSYENSEKLWDFEVFADQIKMMWSFSGK